MLIYTGYVKPFERRIHNKLEIANETLILLNSYFMIIFSDFVPDARNRYAMGWCNLGIIFVLVIVNFGIIGVTIGRRAYLVASHAWLKRKRSLLIKQHLARHHARMEQAQA